MRHQVRTSYALPSVRSSYVEGQLNSIEYQSVRWPFSLRVQQFSFSSLIIIQLVEKIGKLLELDLDTVFTMINLGSISINLYEN